MSPDEDQCLVCFYIDPSSNEVYDAEIIIWVRQSEIENGLDDHLFKFVKKWTVEAWSFKNPGFPGREISWEEWNKL
jgi:hypothetical protein